MIGRRALTFAAVAASSVLLTGAVSGQQQKSLKDQLVGTWTLLLADTVNADKTQTPNFGPNPDGIVVFDASGHYVLVLERSNLPKFASNNRTTGTPAENKAVVAGTLTHFGTYTVDEAKHTLTFHIQSSSFPNWEGTQQTRPIDIPTADNLKWDTPQASGGGSAVVYWRRAK